MRLIKHRRPIEIKQLCGIARVLILKEPTLSDSEWKARVRETAAKQGYDEGTPETLALALTQVEEALKRTMGPRRHGVAIPAQPPAKPTLPSKPTRQEWDTMAATVRAVIDRSAKSFGLPAMPPAREILRITEHAALDQFYVEANAAGSDRIAVLKRFAELAIAREAEWNVAAVRAASGDHALRAHACFGCLRPSTEIAIDWHHVIQIQHGGSNLLRNRVALCGTCHAEIHPWLSRTPRSKPGLRPLSECMGGVTAVMDSWKKASA